MLEVAEASAPTASTSPTSSTPGGASRSAEDLSRGPRRKLLLERALRLGGAPPRSPARARVVTGSNDSDARLPAALDREPLRRRGRRRRCAAAAARARGQLRRRADPQHRLPGRVHPDQFWRSAVLGDVRKQRFAAILEHPLREQLRERLEHLEGRCGGCSLRRAVPRLAPRAALARFAGSLGVGPRLRDGGRGDRRGAPRPALAAASGAGDGVRRRRRALALALACWSRAGHGRRRGGIGSRVFVVERASGSLAVYDFVERKLLPKRITGLGNLRHATMIFSPDLRYGYLATAGRQGEPHRSREAGARRRGLHLPRTPSTTRSARTAASSPRRSTCRAASRSSTPAASKVVKRAPGDVRARRQDPALAGDRHRRRAGQPLRLRSDRRRRRSG